MSSDPSDSGETVSGLRMPQVLDRYTGRPFVYLYCHSGAKKAHDWAVDQLADLFRTTHRVKTQQVVKILGQHCGDVELAGYLTNPLA